MNTKLTEITIRIPRDTADSLSLALADLLCWHRGFTAALGDDPGDRKPMGTWAAREMNIALKDALNRAEFVDTGGSTNEH